MNEYNIIRSGSSQINYDVYSTFRFRRTETEENVDVCTPIKIKRKELRKNLVSRIMAVKIKDIN